MNKEQATIVEATKKARAILQKQRGHPVEPHYSMCGAVSDLALRLLFQPNLKTHEFRVPDGDHVVIQKSDKSTVFDAQYKQFIPPEKRDGLPDVLIVQPKKFRRLKLTLQAMGMNKPTAKAYAKAVLK